MDEQRETAGTASARTPPAPRSWAMPQDSVPGKSQSPRGAETGLQAHRRDKHEPDSRTN